MTNLTSEQYRDVLKFIPNCTEKIPTVQHLLRKAVETFYERFGGYPEIAGVAPGKVGIFGEQTQFADGLAMPAATPMMTIIVGRKVPGPRFSVVTSADVGKPHKVRFSFSKNRPLGPGCPSWLNYIKGIIDNYSEKVPPFEAAIESSVPMGVGFGSSSAIEVATYSFLEVLIGKKDNPIEKAKACQKAEKEFAGKEVGPVDRITSILAKDRHTMLIDCKTNEVTWIPFRNPKVALVAVNSHLEDTIFGHEYPERTKYLAKACEILGAETLRECTEDDLLELENRVAEILEEKKKNENEKGEEEEEGKKEEKEIKTKKDKEEEEENEWTKEEYDIMIKRARFFITEMNRITEAMEAWNAGDIDKFGEKMKESHESLKKDFDFNNPLLNFLVETSLQVEGVLGSRMTGMGLGYGGGMVSLVNKENIAKYCTYITEKFTEFESQLVSEVKEARRQEKDKRFEIQNKYHSKHYNPAIASSEKIGKIQDYLEAGGVLEKAFPRKLSITSAKRCSPKGSICVEKKREPCIVKVDKPKSGCGTWAKYQKEQQKEDFMRKSLEEEKEEGTKTPSVSSQSNLQLCEPSFYVISPFAGARMMFVTKTDILRSLYANPVPQPKILVRSALKRFLKDYGDKPEAVGAAPATLCLFGEFMEFHLGYIVCMALPLYCIMVGGRNDTVLFSVETTSKEVEEPFDVKYPLPSVRALKLESRSWVNYIMGVVSEFKGHIPGFNAVIHSNVPLQIGINSCAALQASVYTFLENLTRTCTDNLFEKAERCARSEYEFLPAPSELVSRCSTIKFFPTFMSKEGHVMFINCKKYKISHYFFDHPSYAFIIAYCKKNDTEVTVESLEDRLKQCMVALDILGRTSLLNSDLKHLRCLRKRDATEEMIKRVKYVITEHQRTVEAIKAIKDEDYCRVGCLMQQSHASLRDDYEVSSPQIEELIRLAVSVEGVLGAKMLGKGLNASIIILVKLSDADKCIRYMKKNYTDKTDKPVFYITKPSRGAFMMNPTVEVPHIP